MYNILIVEDEKITNTFLKTILEEKYDCRILQAFDGDTACDLVIDEHIDLIITDIVMPGIDGWEFLEYLNNIESNIPTVIISSLSGKNDQLKGYSFKIEDFLVKPIDEELWLAKIDTILKRLYPKTEKLIIDSPTLSLRIDNQEIPLTVKEFDVFNYLYMNEKTVCSKYDILDKFWGSDFDISERVVDHTISRIRNKLGDYAYIIKTKPKIGYYYDFSKED